MRIQKFLNQFSFEHHETKSGFLLTHALLNCSAGLNPNYSMIDSNIDGQIIILAPNYIYISVSMGHDCSILSAVRENIIGP